VSTLDDYPRPSVAVDTALLTVHPSLGLSVVLVAASDGPRLPGAFVHERETLAAAVLRSLADKAGVNGLAPRQLRVFDDPERDDRGWVLSVAHTDVVAASRLSIDDAKALLAPTSALPPLPWGHELIVAHAVETLRAAYRQHPDPFGLIESPFTVRALRQLHEAVAGTALPKDAFARAMLPHLVDTGTKAAGTVGKPPRLFTTTREAA
jgi:8-oxo-dGTP diphosphatase